MSAVTSENVASAHMRCYWARESFGPIVDAEGDEPSPAFRAAADELVDSVKDFIQVTDAAPFPVLLLGTGKYWWRRLRMWAR